jgi:hypothetical protein
VLHKNLGEVCTAIMVEVHCQEGYFRSGIRVAETVVEFNAVINTELIGETYMG